MIPRDKEYFPYIFWFIVGVTAYGGGISVMAVLVDPTRIDIVLTFWLSTAVASGIGYLVGKSAKENSKKQGEPGSITVEPPATITATTSNSDTKESNNGNNNIQPTAK